MALNRKHWNLEVSLARLHLNRPGDQEIQFYVPSITMCWINDILNEILRILRVG